MKRLLGTLTMMLVMLFSINLVAAQDFDISKVEVNDVTATELGDAVFVEAGSDVEVEVFIDGNGSSDSVRVKAWIGGYEYDEIEDRTDIFEVEPNVDYKKTLNLYIPEDIDASDDYTLHVEVFDDDNNVEKEFTLRLQERRHFLNIQDIILRPSSVEAGRSLFATVRVENLGDKKEEDIQVNVAIPELGVSARDYIDELVPQENTDDDDEETSASSNEIFLRIPSDAKSGDYNLVVEVVYNRGHDIVTGRAKVVVEGVSVVKEDSLVNIDSQSKTVNPGEQVIYKVMVANMGDVVQRYSLEISGESLWATSRVDPLFVSVKPGETAELNALLTVKEDSPAGRNSFLARVRSGEDLVKEFSLSADVSNGANFGEGTRKALTVVFGVLVVLLIILGLVVAFNRMKGSEGEGEEGTNYY